METLSIHTEGVLGGTSEVEVAIGEGSSCADVIKQLVEEYQLSTNKVKGAWLLQEEWHGCRHWLALEDLVPTGGVVKLYLRQCPRRHTPDTVKQWNRKTRRCKSMDEQFLDSPSTFLSTSLTSQQLCCVSSCLRRQLNKTERKYSSTLLQRLARKQRLWGPQETTPFDTLTTRLNTLEEENLKVSMEVSTLNIQCTRLTQQIQPVSHKAEQLRRQLEQLQQQVKTKREERAKNAPKKVERMQSELDKLKKELEIKNQLNSGLNSKLQKVKEHLKMQQKVLEDKKAEIEKLRGWGTDDTHAQVNTAMESHSHTSVPTHSSNSHSNLTQTPQSLKRNTPSSSRKRHGNIIEAKSRQLVEEEGAAFRQTKHEGVVATPPSEHVLNIPEVPAMPTKGHDPQKAKKNVHFEAEAIVLNVALEGELELLKECIKKIGGCGYSNDKGATCLHNAVCSGNFEAISYLVDKSCDINAQDIDGWTPLHCAVAYSNLDVVRYLVEHGASLYLSTKDGDTPLNIAQEEYKLWDGQSNSENLHAATECLQYLKDMDSGLGVLNGGVVFALFDYSPEEAGEIPLTEGERLIVCGREDDKWWQVRNGRGQIGEVPCTFLGLYRPTKDVL